MVIVRFLVGEDEAARARAARTRSWPRTHLRSRLAPRRRSSQPRSIDDVPVMALTLWGPRYDDVRLRADGRAAARRRQGSARTSRTSPSSAAARGKSRSSSIRPRSRRGGLDPLGVQQALAPRTSAPPPATLSAPIAPSSSRPAAGSPRSMVCEHTVVAIAGGAPVLARATSPPSPTAPASPTATSRTHTRQARPFRPSRSRSRSARARTPSACASASRRRSTRCAASCCRATPLTVTRNYGETAAREVERAALAHAARGPLGVAADRARARAPRAGRRADRHSR